MATNIPVFAHDGAKKSDLKLNETVFAVEVNERVVHDVVVAMRANARQGSAHTKDRSEVSGTGKKPWKQKGTGRARHGSKRSPIWVGGGITFGPRVDKIFSKKTNKKTRLKALAMALSSRAAEGSLCGLEAIVTSEAPKTSEVAKMLESLASKNEAFKTLPTKSNDHNALVIIPEHSEFLFKSFRNIPYVNVANASDVNTFDIVRHRYVVMVDAQKAHDVIVDRMQRAGLVKA